MRAWSCLAVSADLPFAQPADALHKMLHADPELSARFANARAAAAPVMLGPMAVDASAAGEPGLLLAGDAAGFIDPMTGDGLRFALMGAELAAAIVKEVFDGSLSIDRAHLELSLDVAIVPSRRSGDSIARCDRWSRRRRA